jgi:hypothetical protein
MNSEGKIFALGGICPFHLFFGVIFEIFLIGISRLESEKSENGICGLKRINRMARGAMKIGTGENDFPSDLEFIGEDIFSQRIPTENIKYPQGSSIETQSPNQFLFHFGFLWFRFVSLSF